MGSGIPEFSDGIRRSSRPDRSGEEVPGSFGDIDAPFLANLAADKVEGIDLEGRGPEVLVAFEELPDGFIGSLIDPGKGNMGIVDPFFGFNPDIKEGILNFFLELKEVGVATSESGPDSVSFSDGRKAAGTLDREEEGLDGNGIDSCFEVWLELSGEVSDVLQRKVKALRGDPIKAAKIFLLQGSEALLDVRGEGDSEKKAFSAEIVTIKAVGRCCFHGLRGRG